MDKIYKGKGIKRTKRQTDKIGGYFTVEAAMVLPIVLFSIALVICLLIFQYNRCLMEQDVGTLALRGAGIQAADPQDRMEKFMQQADTTDQKKYIGWENSAPNIELGKGKVRVEQRGEMIFVLSQRPENSGSVWMAGTFCENHIISPVSFIRNYRKIEGGMKDADGIY